MLVYQVWKSSSPLMVNILLWRSGGRLSIGDCVDVYG